MTTIIEISDRAGAVLEPQWLLRAEPVHRQLRPQLGPDYAAQMKRIFDAGASMIVSSANDRVLGLAVWRSLLNTSSGKVLYVDDLVTDSGERSKGVGRALLKWLETRARQMQCDALTLDSGTQRARAHEFYFREGMHIAAFHFTKSV